jgi:hypothetical protein
MFMTDQVRKTFTDWTPLRRSHGWHLLKRREARLSLGIQPETVCSRSPAARAEFPSPAPLLGD